MSMKKEWDWDPMNRRGCEEVRHLRDWRNIHGGGG